MTSLILESPNLIAVLVLVCVAAVIERRTRRIPNWLNAAGCFVGLGLIGVDGLVAAHAGGLLAGLIAGLALYAGGVAAAGYVKLLAAIGAIVGPIDVLIAVVPAPFLLARIWWQQKSQPPPELQFSGEAAPRTLYDGSVVSAFGILLAIGLACIQQEDMRSLDELFLFRPARHPHGNWQPAELEYEDVYIEAPDGVNLHAWYCPVEKPVATVVFFHGNAGNIGTRVNRLMRIQRELQCTTLMVDYRGYGRSEGVPTIKGVLSDAHVASSYLAERTGVDESELVVWGRSLGGAVATEIAARTQPRLLIVESTFSSLRNVAGTHFPGLSWLVGRNRLNSAERIRSFNGHLLLSHGTEDSIVPYDSGRQLFESATGPKQFVEFEGLGHNDAPPDHWFETVSQTLAESR
ncbi:MAG: alpha/beta fold hydrolase [Planctomycetota bacterium]